jgi:hypothetical protein
MRRNIDSLRLQTDGIPGHGRHHLDAGLIIINRRLILSWQKIFNVAHHSTVQIIYVNSSLLVQKSRNETGPERLVIVCVRSEILHPLCQDPPHSVLTCPRHLSPLRSLVRRWSSYPFRGTWTGGLGTLQSCPLSHGFSFST